LYSTVLNMRSRRKKNAPRCHPKRLHGSPSDMDLNSRLVTKRPLGASAWQFRESGSDSWCQFQKPGPVPRFSLSLAQSEGGQRGAREPQRVSCSTQSMGRPWLRANPAAFRRAKGNKKETCTFSSLDKGGSPTAVFAGVRRLPETICFNFQLPSGPGGPQSLAMRANRATPQQENHP